MSASVHYSQARQDWETPPALFAEYDAEFHFTLDVCATLANTKVPHFHPPETDGLSQDWSRDVCWMNPPYGRAIGQWMAKAYTDSLRGATVVCLVPARTDTRWWHDYAMRGEIRFLKGRVRFLVDGAEKASHPSRRQGANAPFPCAIVVFRPPALALLGNWRSA